MGLLGETISYALAQWDRLLVYLDKPMLTPDNNLAENAIRPFVLGRRTGCSLEPRKVPRPAPCCTV